MREGNRPATLILIKHARPQIVPAQRAPQWRLGDEGRRQCDALAETLARWQPELLIASAEPKATETAQLTAQRLGVPWRTAPGLHEHDRSRAPYLADDEAYRAQIRELFARPDEPAFGTETARAALARFSAALDDALASVTERSVAVVTHGTVISLYAAHRFGMDGYTLWWRLGLPARVVADAPDLAEPFVIEQIG